MSRPVTETISCPGCGREQQFVIWSSVNVSLDASLKEKVLDGSLFQFECETCGHTAGLEYGMLYHDMNRSFMCWLVPGGGNEPPGDEISGPFMNLMQDGYSFRYVRSRNELVEKILIQDSDLDDRLVELFKLVMREQLDEAFDPDQDQIFYSGCSTGTEEDSKMEFALVGESGSRQFSVPVSTFHQFAERAEPVLNAMSEEPDTWLRVDAEYVMGF